MWGQAIVKTVILSFRKVQIWTRAYIDCVQSFIEKVAYSAVVEKMAEL